MREEISPLPSALRPAQRAALSEGHVRRTLAAATGRIAPVWDVKAFIAANALRGFEDRPFIEAAAAARAYFHADALMPAGFYHDQYRAGRITADDLRSAVLDLDEGRPLRAERLLRAADAPPVPGRHGGSGPEVRTLAERASTRLGAAQLRAADRPRAEQVVPGLLRPGSGGLGHAGPRELASSPPGASWPPPTGPSPRGGSEASKRSSPPCPLTPSRPSATCSRRWPSRPTTSRTT